MRHRKHHHRFWHGWDEEIQEDDEWEAAFEEQAAWRGYFSNFLGIAPEKHWLFGGRRFKPWITGRMGPPGMFNPFIAELMSKGGGLLPLFVMHLLNEKPRYGNDIMREIEQRTHGRWASNPGAIYPLLTIMEDSDLVIGEWEDPEKRTRRIYRLTPKGQLEYERLKEVMRPKLEEVISILREIFVDLESEEVNHS